MQSLIREKTKSIITTQTTAHERRPVKDAFRSLRRKSFHGPWLQVLMLTSMLTSCTTVAPPSTPTQETWQTRKTQLERIQSWQLNGKVGVQTAQDSGSATIDWEENRGNYTVNLYAPLGAGTMKLSGRPGSATLVMPDGKKFTASSPEALLAKNWGFNLPVSYLRYWVRGLPVPGTAANLHFDAFNRVTSFSQQGWQVQIQSYTRAGGAELPSRLSISSATLHGKLVIHTWNI